MTDAARERRRSVPVEYEVEGIIRIRSKSKRRESKGERSVSTANLLRTFFIRSPCASSEEGKLMALRE